MPTFEQLWNAFVNGRECEYTTTQGVTIPGYITDIHDDLSEIQIQNKEPKITGGRCVYQYDTITLYGSEISQLKIK